MSLVSYDINDGSDESSDEDINNFNVNNNQINNKLGQSLGQINSAPQVIDYRLDVEKQFGSAIDPKCEELSYNPKYDDLFAPILGPINPFKSSTDNNKNFLTGNIESAHVSHSTFELQRKHFHAYGLANNPSDGALNEQHINNVFIYSSINMFLSLFF